MSAGKFTLKPRYLRMNRVVPRDVQGTVRGTGSMRWRPSVGDHGGVGSRARRLRPRAFAPASVDCGVFRRLSVCFRQSDGRILAQVLGGSFLHSDPGTGWADKRFKVLRINLRMTFCTVLSRVSPIQHTRRLPKSGLN
jgi:hypothetical protein